MLRYSESIGDPKSLLAIFEDGVGSVEKLRGSISGARQTITQTIEAEREYRTKNPATRIVDKDVLVPGYSAATDAAYAAYFKVTREQVNLSGVGHKLFLSILQTMALPMSVRKKVESASKYYIKTPRKPRMKEHGDARYLEMLDVYEKFLAEVQGHLATARKAIEQGSGHVEGATRLRVGDFTLVNTGGFDAKTMDAVSDTIGKCQTLLKSAGFAKMCYGDVQVTNTISKGSVLAFYLMASDEMFVRANIRNNADMVKTFLHEIGHRYEHKVMQSKRKDIARLYNLLSWQDQLQKAALRTPSPGEELRAKGKEYRVKQTIYNRGGYTVILDVLGAPGTTARVGLRAYLDLRGETTRDLENPDYGGFVTDYAGKDPSENFAEMFALYCMGSLPTKLKGLFESAIHGTLTAVLVASRYAATIDKDALDKWQKDLKVLTRIYRSIPVEEDSPETREAFFEGMRIFRTFRENFNQWVYRVLLNKKDMSPLEKVVAKDAWDFQDALTRLFPTMHGDIPDLAEVRHSRERGIKRYQTAAVKAFRSIREYVDARGGGSLQRHDPVTTTDVGGIPVTLLNFNRDDESEEDLGRTLSQLKKWVSAVDAAGFSKATRGLSVTIDFWGKEIFTNGKYSPNTDTLTLFPLGMAGTGTGRTIAHEIGHRFYFKALPGRARSSWETTISDKGVRLTHEIIGRFADAILPSIDPLWSESDVLRVALAKAETESDAAAFRELAAVPIVPWSRTELDREDYLDRLSKYEGELVHIEEISEYAKASPVEAFAECFRLWVWEGPGSLGPWTREFFRETCRAGGAKL